MNVTHHLDEESGKKTGAILEYFEFIFVLLQPSIILIIHANE